MAAANIASGVLNAVLFIYLARVLLPEGFGYLSCAFALAFFLCNFVDLGLSTYGAREIARNRSRYPDYASEIVSLRLVIAICVTLLFTGVMLIFRLSPGLKILMIGSALVFLKTAFSCEWVFQGMQEMAGAFGFLTLMAALQVGLVMAFVKGPDDIFAAPVLYFAPGIPVALLFLKRVNFRFMLKASDLKRIAAHLSGSLTIWSVSLLAQVYNGFDIFMLGLFRRMDEVGYFTIARRIIGEAAMLMIFLANAVLPHLSCSFQGDMSGFAVTVRKFLKLAAALTVLGVLPAVLFSGPLICMTVGDEYRPASIAFNIMAIGLIMVLFNLPYSTALIAAGLERDVLKQTSAAAAMSILLNFILMPRYGMIGGSISFVIVEAAAFVWILRVYNRKLVKGG